MSPHANEIARSPISPSCSCKFDSCDSCKQGTLSSEVVGMSLTCTIFGSRLPLSASLTCAIDKRPDDTRRNSKVTVTLPICIYSNGVDKVIIWVNGKCCFLTFIKETESGDSECPVLLALGLAAFGAAGSSPFASTSPSLWRVAKGRWMLEDMICAVLSPWTRGDREWELGTEARGSGGHDWGSFWPVCIWRHDSSLTLRARAHGSVRTGYCAPLIYIFIIPMEKSGSLCRFSRRHWKDVNKCNINEVENAS